MGAMQEWGINSGWGIPSPASRKQDVNIVQQLDPLAGAGKYSPKAELVALQAARVHRGVSDG